MPAPIDLTLLRQFRTRAHAPALECGVLAFTRLGEHGLMWLALAAAGAALGAAVAELAV